MSNATTIILFCQIKIIYHIGNKEDIDTTDKTITFFTNITDNFEKGERFPVF